MAATSFVEEDAALEWVEIRLFTVLHEAFCAVIVDLENIEPLRDPVFELGKSEPTNFCLLFLFIRSSSINSLIGCIVVQNFLLLLATQIKKTPGRLRAAIERVKIVAVV